MQKINKLLFPKLQTGKTIKIKYLFLSLLIFSCNPTREDAQVENYDEIFPFQGIESPDVSYEDMTLRRCDPDIPLTRYKYLGVHIADAKEYTVTLKCRYTDAGNYPSRYVIRFVGPDKELHTIGSDENSEHTLVMEEGQELVQTFKVKSGYPMYLSVNGVGDRGSHVEASISAVSDDGYITSPVLNTVQYQNNEGPNRIPNPYCQYIILP